MNSLITTGSVLDHAQKLNTDLATAFLDVRLILLCDRSGSMCIADVKRGETYRTRYQVEDEIVAQLQQKHEGKILIASFRDATLLHPDGRLPYPGGGTYIKKGLEKIRPYLVGDIQAILISDGEPSDSEQQILAYALSNFMGKLDTMFAGPKGSPGEQFLRRLAQVCHGEFQTEVLNYTRLLADRVERLLLQATV